VINRPTIQQELNNNNNNNNEQQETTTFGLMSIRNETNLKASRNITLMVIFQCVLYTFGMCPYLIAYILGYVLEQTPDLEIFTDISYGILYISHGSTLFIYISFNKYFRQVLNGYFNFIK
jgi:hypothetical protein